MFEIIDRRVLAEGILWIDVRAGEIARRARPGQFVTVVPEGGGEAVPLSVVDTDLRAGGLTLIFEESSPEARRLGRMPIHGVLDAVTGPLGRPATIATEERVVCVSEGIGTARMLPIARALKTAGNKVTGLLGAARRTEVILEPQMRLSCRHLTVATRDGSYQRKGTPAALLREVLDAGDVDRVYCAGSVETMEEVCDLSGGRGVPVRIYIEPFGVCGMGTCGGCRLMYDGRMVPACEDGPEFDGLRVDFAVLRRRLLAGRMRVPVGSDGGGRKGLWRRLFVGEEEGSA